MRKRRLRSAALVAVAVAASGAGAAPADAGRDTERLLRVVHPRHGEGIHSSLGAKVKIAVRRGASVRVRIGSRNVTRSLNLRTVRTRKGRRIMRGRLSRSLTRRGPTVLRFIARAGSQRDQDDVLVQSVRRRESFLSLRLRKAGRTRIAIVRTKAHRMWLRAELNGRRIEEVATSRRLGKRRLRLTRAEGLRHGRNVLVVAANDARGRGDVERRVFRMPRRGVIPGVNAPDQARVRAPVHLDAGPSAVRPRRQKLAYRWRFASRPPGSRAKIRGRRGRAASFHPDRPGRYSVRLTVRRRGGGRTSAADCASAACAAGRASKRTSLVTAVDAQRPIPPYGLDLQTEPTKGVTLAGKTFGIGPNRGRMMAIIIDERSGAVKDGVQWLSDIGDDQAYLVKDLVNLLNDEMNPNYLVAVLGRGGAKVSSAQSAFLKQLPLAKYGFDSDAVELIRDAMRQGKPFALLGSPGDVVGTGVANASSGVLDGRLRLTGLSTGFTGTLVFEQPDYRVFQLGGGSGSTKVSGINPPDETKPTQPLDKPLGHGEAMQVTILDAVTLEEVDGARGRAGGQDGAIAPVRRALERNDKDPYKLILFKMNAPRAWENTRLDMSPISKRLASIGANRDLFIRSLTFPRNQRPFHNPPEVPHQGAQYVFLGGAGVAPIEGSALETAQAPDGRSVALSSPTAAGILRRDELGRWVPVSATRTGIGGKDAITQPLLVLATRAPTPYDFPKDPPGTDHQYAAAEDRLFDLLVAAKVLCKPGPDCATPSGIRVNYANLELLSGLDDALGALQCPQGTAPPAPLPPGPNAPYTQEQLNALQSLVCNELADIRLVHKKLFGPLRKVYAGLEKDSTLDLLHDSSEFLGFLKDKEDARLKEKANWLGISGEAGEILGDLVSAATEIAEYVLAPETGGGSILAGELVGELLSIGGSSLSLAGEARGVGESADEVAPALVKVGTLYTYIKQAFGYASARLTEAETLVTSDPTKLAEAADRVDDGKWDLLQGVNQEHQAFEVIEFQQEVAAQQYMLPRLISAVAKPCDTGGSAKDPTTYEAWTALGDPGAGGFNYLLPRVNRLRSAHLTSGDAAKLGPRLFGPPFKPNTDPIALGPIGAALAPSSFFMTQIAQTSSFKQNQQSACGELFHR